MGTFHQLVNVLNRIKDSLGGFRQLENAIKKATQVSGRPPIDRRKLARLLGNSDGGRKENTPLTVAELEALDTFLRAEAEGGLAGVFDPQRKNLLRIALERRDVALVVGSVPVEGDLAERVSPWDVKSVAELVPRLTEFAPNVQLSVKIVPLCTSLDTSDVVEWCEKETECTELFDVMNGPSVVVLGSPRQCHAAEIALAHMTGVKPFKQPVRKTALPFRFLWQGNEFEKAPPSAFSEKINKPPLETPIEAKTKIRGLRIGKRDLEVDTRQEKWQTYAVIAAQQLAGGQVWITCCGLSGTGTLASVRGLNRLTAELPMGRAGKTADMIWTLVTADVQGDPKAKIGDRRVVIQETCDEWQKFTYPKRQK